MKIYVTSVFVDDQDKAEKFYTEILGFKVKHNIPLGTNRWLTVVSEEDPDGTELLLEQVIIQPWGHTKKQSSPMASPHTHFKCKTSMQNGRN